MTTLGLGLVIIFLCKYMVTIHFMKIVTESILGYYNTKQEMPLQTVMEDTW